MAKIKFTATYGLQIPFLQSRPMGVVFPMLDYVKGGPLPDEQQVIDVTPEEAESLVRQGHFVYVIEKKSKKEEVEA